MDIASTVVATEGQSWQKDLPDLGDLELLVAPWENPAFERTMQKLIRALPAGLRADGNVEPAAYRRALGTAMSKTIIFGWKNFTDGGIEVPFTAETAAKYLTDPRYKPLSDGVIAAAKRAQLGVKADQDATVGNS
jgi:hypothetical protein